MACPAKPQNNKAAAMSPHVFFMVSLSLIISIKHSSSSLQAAQPPFFIRVCGFPSPGCPGFGFI
jgi:hypothetical protein